MSEQYSIPISGLQEGHHFFSFSIDKGFFDLFEESEVKQGNLKVVVDYLHGKTLSEITISIEGVVEVMCDRCLDFFNLPISTTNSLLVKKGSQIFDESEDAIMVSYNDKSVDLKQYIYDFIIIALPLQKVHADKLDGSSGCNSAMIEKLSYYVVNVDKSTDVD